MTQDELKALLRVMHPTLFTVDVFIERFLKDMKMQYGEITFKAQVQNGKIVRVEATPTFSQKTDNLT